MKSTHQTPKPSTNRLGIQEGRHEQEKVLVMVMVMVMEVVMEMVVVTVMEMVMVMEVVMEMVMLAMVTESPCHTSCWFMKSKATCREA